MMDATTRFLVNRIRQELERPVTCAQPGQSGGIAVRADDDLPRGWVRLSDASGRVVYGLAADILALLELARDDEGQPGAWEALAPEGYARDHQFRLYDSAPESAEVWDDFHSFTGIETGGGLGVYVVETNYGLKYVYARAGGDYSAFTTRSDRSEWFHTAAEALEATEDLEAAEERNQKGLYD